MRFFYARKKHLIKYSCMVRLLSLLLFVSTAYTVKAADTTATWNDVIKTFKKRIITADDIKPSTIKKALRHIEVMI
jgi:hypothetical protein